MKQNTDHHIGRARSFELPSSLQPEFQHVRKLEWITLAYLASVVNELIELSLKQEWVKDGRLRMRENGMVFFGDMFVIPKSEENLMDNIDQLSRKAINMDWKIEDIVIHPVRGFPNPNIRKKRSKAQHINLP